MTEMNMIAFNVTMLERVGDTFFTRMRSPNGHTEREAIAVFTVCSIEAGIEAYVSMSTDLNPGAVVSDVTQAAEILSRGEVAYMPTIDMFAVLNAITDNQVMHLCFDIVWDPAEDDNEPLPSNIIAILASMDDGVEELREALGEAAGVYPTSFRNQPIA